MTNSSYVNFVRFVDTTPPKTVLSDKAATLIEAHLVPMTRVYVGLEDVPSGENHCELFCL